MAKKPKVKAPPEAPSIRAIANMARRERVKQYILRGKMTVEDMAEEEGVERGVISKDIKCIKNENILAPAKEATRLAYLEYSSEIEWAVEEAKRLHEEVKEERDGKGGRIDCLKFVTDRRKEEMEMAQKLGLLDLAAEKQEHDHVHHFKVDDPELIKKFGDFIASKSSDS
ncbi:MAG: hypothetical protein WC102_03215 [Saccharofermentanales bacterium]